MSTYILRHGSTRPSTMGVVSGNPERRIPIDADGHRQAKMRSTERWTSDVVTVVTSSLERTRQTADLLFESSRIVRWADARFDEINYGVFEGGLWTSYGTWLRSHGAGARPAGSTESWNEAMGRVLDGLTDVLCFPRPRAIIGHGFWISGLLSLQDGKAWEHCADLGAPEHVCPVLFSDRELRLVIERGREATADGSLSDALMPAGSDVRGVRGTIQ
jgi:broad specificity phosphatase PhoE